MQLGSSFELNLETVSNIFTLLSKSIGMTNLFTINVWKTVKWFWKHSHFEIKYSSFFTLIQESRLNRHQHWLLFGVNFEIYSVLHWIFCTLNAIEVEWIQTIETNKLILLYLNGSQPKIIRKRRERKLFLIVLLPFHPIILCIHFDLEWFWGLYSLLATLVETIEDFCIYKPKNERTMYSIIVNIFFPKMFSFLRKTAIHFHLLALSGRPWWICQKLWPFFFLKAKLYTFIDRCYFILHLSQYYSLFISKKNLFCYHDKYISIIII